MAKDSRCSENCRALGADEVWSDEGLGDTASQFKKHLIGEQAWPGVSVIAGARNHRDRLGLPSRQTQSDLRPRRI